MGKSTINHLNCVYFMGMYPLVISDIAIEHGPFIVDLPTQNGDFL